MILAFNKPYGVLSQFTSGGTPHPTLAAFGFPPRVYPVGRLDRDSEGLLLMSDERGFTDALLHPERGHTREYWVQVEGAPTDGDLAKLQAGVTIQNRRTLPAEARVLTPQPEIPERIPPVRFRARIPTTWITITLTEGKNRQVRRMTAATGFPTLRLIRVRIGDFSIGELPPGKWREITGEERRLLVR